ncbi:hypothetical protein [Pedobacter sp. ASV28]|uniref:hypothetical protein n=1 Tax=Pedobacter sp. ASV28 TaxID=2795123 RepID=UPI0018EAE4FF|nr:hypothetical protein [Pedobacter sp. ASV28]
MKRSITIIIMALFAVSCKQSSKKETDKANEDFNKGDKELAMVAKESDSLAREKIAADWRHFKQHSDSTLTTMDKDMVATDARVAKANKKEQLKLNKDIKKAKLKLDQLKQKLKKEDEEFNREMHALNEEAKVRNEYFKREFDHDSHELGTALKDIFKDNVK